MNWTEAVEAMKAGKRVQRVSEAVRTHIEDNIYEEGMGALRLVRAWTHDSKPVMVFVQENWQPTMPDEEDMEATDWIAL